MTKTQVKSVIGAIFASVLMLALGPFLAPRVGGVIYIILIAIAIGLAIGVSKRIPLIHRRKDSSDE